MTGCKFIQRVRRVWIARGGENLNVITIDILTDKFKPNTATGACD
jgi:hypothetical protein